MSFEATSQAGTPPLATRLNLCHTISMRDREMAELQAEYEASRFTSTSSLLRFENCPLSHPNAPTTCYDSLMTINRSALITALYNEYKYLCHDDFDPDVDATPDEYLAMLQSLTDAELVDEASDDDINEFISTWQ